MSELDEMTGAMAGRAWRQIARRIGEINARTRFYSGKQHEQIRDMIALAEKWARIADGKAGKHDHQRG